MEKMKRGPNIISKTQGKRTIHFVIFDAYEECAIIGAKCITNTSSAQNLILFNEIFAPTTA